VDEHRFRAYIKGESLHFTLQSLADPTPLFSVREIVKPWLFAGNRPDRWTGRRDKANHEIYAGDIVQFGDVLFQVIDDGVDLVLREPGHTEDDDLDDFLSNYDDHDLKIVGNVYVNAELMKKGPMP